MNPALALQSKSEISIVQCSVSRAPGAAGKLCPPTGSGPPCWPAPPPPPRPPSLPSLAPPAQPPARRQQSCLHQFKYGLKGRRLLTESFFFTFPDLAHDLYCTVEWPAHQTYPACPGMSAWCCSAAAARHSSRGRSGEPSRLCEPRRPAAPGGGWPPAPCRTPPVQS